MLKKLKKEGLKFHKCVSIGNGMLWDAGQKRWEGTKMLAPVKSVGDSLHKSRVIFPSLFGRGSTVTPVHSAAGLQSVVLVLLAQHKYSFYSYTQGMK